MSLWFHVFLFRQALRGMTSGFQRRWSESRLCRRGAAAAEFALVLPLLLLILFGSIQYGALLFTYNSLQTVARNGARALASGSATVAEVSARVAAELPGWVSADDVQIEAGDAGNNRVHMALSVPAAQATVVRLVPMPAMLSVDVVMRREPIAAN